MWQKIKCWLGLCEMEKLPDDYDVTMDWECWKNIDFDNHGELYKCKHCGAIVEVKR